MKKKLFTLFTLLLCLVSNGAWADSQTIQAGTVSSGAFTYSSLTAYSYNDSYWAKKNNSDVISIEKGSSFTFTNTGGVTITGITVKGVAQNNNDQNSTITISDDATTPNSVTAARTGSDKWANRQNTTPTSVVISSGISDLKMTAGTVYTVSNGNTNSDYSLGIQIEITYTTSGGGGSSKTALTGAWDPTSVTVNKGASSPDAPTFTLSAGTLGTDYTVTYSKVSGADGIVTFTESGGISAISTENAGTATIRATAALTETGAESYTLATTTYDITVTVNKPDCAAPVITCNGVYDYKQGGYSFTATCETDGATLQWRLKGESSYHSCTAGEPFYVNGTGDNNGKLIVKATKSGYNEKATTTSYNLNTAPSTTSPETLIPFLLGDDNTFKNHAYKYRSVTIGEESNGASIGGTNGTEQLKVRTNQTWDEVANSMNIYVNKGYKVTNVTITGKTNSTDAKKVVAVSGLTVDGVDKTSQITWGDETTYFPISSADAKSCSTGTIAATSKIKFTFGDGGSETKHTQMLATIVVTYERITTPVSVGAKGYATYCNSTYDLDFTAKSIKAYVVKSTDGSALTLTNVNKVAKNTPVLLYSSEPEIDSQDIPVADTETMDDATGNKLVAGDGNAHTWTEGTAEHYILNTANTPGFYRANNSNVAVGKAYLDLTGVNAARVLSFDLNLDGDVTAITNIEAKANAKSDKVYNLNGQQVAQPTKGLYIVNGKKVIIK